MRYTVEKKWTPSPFFVYILKICFSSVKFNKISTEVRARGQGGKGERTDRRGLRKYCIKGMGRPKSGQGLGKNTLTRDMTRVGGWPWMKLYFILRPLTSNKNFPIFKGSKQVTFITTTESRNSFLQKMFDKLF